MNLFQHLSILLITATIITAQTHQLVLTSPSVEDSKVAPLLGVISGPEPNCLGSGPNLPNVAAQYKDIGVMFVRNNDYYDDRLDMERMFRCSDTSSYPSWRCDPDDPSNLHFDGSDEQFKSYLDNGFIPFFRLGGEYENCNEKHDYKGPKDAVEEDNWIRAAIHVVNHYNNFKGKHNVLKYLNIWTEFPGPHFWSRSNQAFYKFWSKAYDSLKSHFPQLKIGGPGFVPKSTLDVINGDVNSVPVEFLSELYQKGIKPDWIGWHYWSNDPTSYITAASQFRDLLNGQGDFQSVPWSGTDFFKDVEMYVDAYGTTTTYYSNGSLVSMSKLERDSIYNKQKGAAILTGDWIAMQYTEVNVACYYRGSPQGETSPDDDPRDPSVKLSGTSLFYGDSAGTAKPTANAFRLWSRIYKKFPLLLQGAVKSVNSNGETIWFLGASNTNNYAVLIANPNKHPQKYSVSIEGKTLDLQNFNSVKIYQVDNNNDGKSATDWNGSPLVIPGYTVQLLIATPKTTSVRRETAAYSARFAIHSGFVDSENNLNLNISSPGNTRAQIFVYNLLGQQVFHLSSINLRSGNQSLSFNLPRLTNGLYFVSLSSEIGISNWKFLLLK